jgi:TatD DNase family protein
MTKTSLVDFHCHLDLYPDHQTAVERREKAQTYTLAVTTTPQAWPQNRDFTAGKRYVRAALGLHPQLVAEHAAEIVTWKKYLPETRYVGEVGLDGGPDYKHSLPKQKEIFADILQTCAIAGDKILSVHSVRAAKGVVELIEANLPVNRGQVVLHWFIGSKKLITRAIAINCFFSFSADMLQTASGRKVAAMVPLERVLTETDAPFTKLPDIEYAVELLAEIHKVSREAIQEAVTQNLKTLLV